MRSSVGPVGWWVPVLPVVCNMSACVYSDGLQSSLVASGGCLVFFLVLSLFFFLLSCLLFFSDILTKSLFIFYFVIN
jgi:hypothetical protein